MSTWCGGGRRAGAGPEPASSWAPSWRASTTGMAGGAPLAQQFQGLATLASRGRAAQGCREPPTNSPKAASPRRLSIRWPGREPIAEADRAEVRAISGAPTRAAASCRAERPGVHAEARRSCCRLALQPQFPGPASACRNALLPGGARGTPSGPGWPDPRPGHNGWRSWVSFGRRSANWSVPPAAGSSRSEIEPVAHQTGAEGQGLAGVGSEADRGCLGHCK